MINWHPESYVGSELMNRSLHKPAAALWLTGVLAILFGGILSLSAQPDASAPARRWLFIVETSKSMKPRANSTLTQVEELLGTSMGSQLTAGDTIGLWTFNERLHTGEVPLQGWSEVTASDIQMSLMSFLNTYKYEKRGNLAAILPAVTGVAKNSEFITILLITDGQDKIQGTPFDDVINTAYDRWKVEQQHNKRAIITMLRAQRGVFTDYSVAPIPWPIQFPPLPPAPPVVVPPKPTPKPPPPMLPAEHFSGKKPQPAAPPPASTNIVFTNAVPTITTNPPAAILSAPIIPSGDTNPSVRVVSSGETLTPPDGMIQTGTNFVPSTKPPEAIHAPITHTAPLTNAASQVADTSSQSPAQFAPTQPPVTASPIAAVPAAPSPGTTPRTITPPALPPVRLPVQAAPAAPPAQTATITFPESGGQENVIWIAGLVLMGLCAGAVVLALLRSRSRPEASSITRSLELDEHHSRAHQIVHFFV
jgi:hypothetical protein